MKPFTILLLILCLLFVFGFGSALADDIKYSLSMFHFNIQYVCGGMEGLIPAPLPPFEFWELTAIETEDMIIVESFEPIVDLFLEHPNWSVTLEMQGYFLDVLAERHPAILEKLWTLAHAGGAEMVSFHYSDQLFIAYPYEDWKHSVQLTIETFEKYDIPLSGTVFCQEGQASPGMAAAMEEFGYKTMVWPKNLWGYQYDGYVAEPYYAFGNVDMIIGGTGVNDGANNVHTTWNFLGDGELVATGDFDPYFPGLFRYKEWAVAKYEAELQEDEDLGYIIGSVTDYMDAVKTAGISPSEAPELLGGTWQPSSTDGTHKWMGGKGLWGNDERDNFVRTSGMIAHRELIAAVVMNEKASLDADDRIRNAWRLLALGQVTDASGINPYAGEIEYGLAHFAEVLIIAREIILRGKIELEMGNVIIDTATGNVIEGQQDDTQPVPVEPPIELEIDAIGRNVEQVWYAVSAAPTIFKLVLNFGRKNSAAFRDIQLRFPGVDGPIEYSPGLAEGTIVSFDRSQYSFEHFYLPLSNGLIGLGGGWYLVKDTSTCHLAAQIFKASPDIVFRDETAAYFETYTYIFYLIQGQQDALSFANSLNITPTLYR